MNEFRAVGIPLLLFLTAQVLKPTPYHYEIYSVVISNAIFAISKVVLSIVVLFKMSDVQSTDKHRTKGFNLHITSARYKWNKIHIFSNKLGLGITFYVA